MASPALDPASLHAAALVIDTHADTPQRFLDECWDFTGGLDSGISTGHLNLATARAGNLAAEWFAIFVDPIAWRGRYAHRALALIDSVHAQIRLHPRELALCLRPDDILAARSDGRFAVLLGLEGGHAIEDSLALLRIFYRLGVRYMTLTWANSNSWAESSGPAGFASPDGPLPRGLTAFGREVIAEMNRLGMIVDVSHVSDRTLADVLAATRAPVLASHSSARALCDSPRNLTDDQLRAIAANGGAVMVNFYSAFVDQTYLRAWLAQKPERSAAHAALEAAHAARGEPVPFHASNAIDREFAARLPRPAFEALMAHFEHLIRVAGIDHVGIGTDFDGISAMPAGMDSAADLPKITAWLVEHGYSDQEIRKVLGENLMRVFRAVEDACG